MIPPIKVSQAKDILIEGAFIEKKINLI